MMMTTNACRITPMFTLNRMHDENSSRLFINRIPTTTFLPVLASVWLALCGCGGDSARKERSTNTPPATDALADAAEAKPPSEEALLAGLPPGVQKAIKDQMGEGDITSIDRTIEDGATTFDVQTSQTIFRNFTVGSDGQLLRYQVFESELPMKVRRTLRADFGKAELGEIYRETEDEEAVYVTDVVEGGRTNTLTLGDGGDWWSLDIELAQVPTAVQATVRRLWGELEATDVSKTSEDGEVTYEFEAEKDDRGHNLTIAPDGRLLAREDELALPLVPASVQAAVSKQIGAGELVRIARATSEDIVSYEIEAMKDGQSVDFRLDATGKLLEDEK